jgi:hypothetical protein
VTLSSVENRAQLIYGFLRGNMGVRFSKAEVLHATGLEPGTKSEAAMRRARDIATADGLHFPPAVPATGFGYMVTELADDAIEPTIHMAKIEAGVRARKEVGEEFIADRLRGIEDPALRRTMTNYLRTKQKIARFSAEMQREVDDQMVELIAVQREVRANNN